MDEVHSNKFTDIEKLAEFIETQRLQVLAFIDRSLGPALRRKLEPEDVFQEVTLSAVSNPAQFNVEGRDPFKLLCQLAEQRIIDAHRHYVVAQKRSVDHEVSVDRQAGQDQSFGLINMLVASMTTPSKAFSRNQKELRLHQAIADLSEEQRDAIRLRYIEGWPTKQIAEKLGKSDGAIRVLLTRTLGRLQELLTDSD